MGKLHSILDGNGVLRILPELEDHFEIFEHIRGFNVTIVTSANTQDETLPLWSGFLQKDEGETKLSQRCRRSEIYEIRNADCSRLNMN